MDFINGLDINTKFNMAMSLKPGSYSGPANGMAFLLDVESYDYGGKKAATNGFRIVVHHYRAAAITDLNGVDLPPGQNMQVG